MPRVPGYALRDRVTIIAYMGSGSHGDIWDTDNPRQVKAHIEPRRRMINSDAGGTVLADATAWIGGQELPVPLQSRLEWPTGSDKWYTVASAGAMPDEVRPAYRELIIEAE